MKEEMWSLWRSITSAYLGQLNLTQKHESKKKKSKEKKEEESPNFYHLMAFQFLPLAAVSNQNKREENERWEESQSPAW